MLRTCLLACALLAPTAVPALAQQGGERKLTEAEKKELDADVEKGKTTATYFGMGLAVFLFVCVLALLFAMIPVFIAMIRHHPNTVPILIICLFFGWTCFGWIAALVWSLIAIQPIEDLRPRARRRPRRYDDDYDD